MILNTNSELATQWAGAVDERSSDSSGSHSQSHYGAASERLVLSRAEERQLGWAILNDNCHDSRERILLANRHLVAAIAPKFAGRGLDIDGLCECGATGLVRAVEHFDPAQGIRFSTLASWWIKRSIKYGLHSASKAADVQATCRRELRIGPARSNPKTSFHAADRSHDGFARLDGPKSQTKNTESKE